MVEKVTVSRWGTIRKVMRTLFAVVALLTGAACLIKIFTHSGAFFAGDQISIYWLVIGELNGQLFILGAISGVSAWLTLQLLSNLGCFERLLITVLCFIAGVGVLTLIGPPVYNYQHSDSIRTPEGVFYVGEEITFWGSCGIIGNDCFGDYHFTPIVFQCGHVGVWCRAIYHAPPRRSTNPDSPPTSTFTLNGSTIRLLVDGEVVWEHPVESGSN
jgi:hypothetical protein